MGSRVRWFRVKPEDVDSLCAAMAFRQSHGFYRCGTARHIKKLSSAIHKANSDRENWKIAVV